MARSKDEINRQKREAYHKPGSTYKALVRSYYEKNKAKVREQMKANNKRYNQLIADAHGMNPGSVPNNLCKFRKEVLTERPACELCGAGGDLRMSYVKSKIRHPELAFDRANVRVFCKGCLVEGRRSVC